MYKIQSEETNLKCMELEFSAHVFYTIILQLFYMAYPFNFCILCGGKFSEIIANDIWPQTKPIV